MGTPTIRFREVESNRPVETTNPDAVKVSIRTEVCYTSNSDKRTQRVFVVSGTVTNQGREYPVNWEFVCPDDFKTSLDAILSPIRSQVIARQGGFMARPNLEIYADLTDWLSVGWKQTHDAFHGYMRFSKDGLSLESKLENLRSFDALQSQVGY